MEGPTSLVLVFAVSLCGCVDPEIARCYDGDFLVARGIPMNDTVTCVIGDVKILDSYQYDDVVSMSALTKIGGSLLSNGSVSVEVPALTSVAGGVYVRGILDAPSLAIVGRFDNASLSLPSLTEVRGSFHVSGQGVRSMRFPMLTRVKGDFIVGNNQVLHTLDFPTLTLVDGAFTVVNNSVLRQCEVDRILARLEPAPSIIDIAGNSGSPNVCR